MKNTNDLALNWLAARGIAGFLLLAFAAPAPAQTQMFQLSTADRTNWDYLGYSVATDGGIIVAGAPFNHDLGLWSGSIYTFDLASGLERMEILPPDPSLKKGFGWSVDVEGNIAVVGAPLDDSGGSVSGSAYVLDVFSGQVLHKLVPPKPRVGLRFGTHVAIEGDWVAVTAPANKVPKQPNAGRVYVYNKTTGALVHTLIGSGAKPGNGYAWSLAMEGSQVLVGSRGDGPVGLQSGAAYLFDLASGQEVRRLTASDGEPTDYFGSAVALSSQWILVGADEEGAWPSPGTEPGAAYLFDRQSFHQVKKFSDPTLLDYSYFGRSVAISGNRVLIGAPGDSGPGSNSGSAYLYDALTGHLIEKFTDSGSTPEEFFGFSIALTPNRAFCGSYGKGGAFNDSGTVTLYDLAPGVGGSYCMALINSSGSMGSIYATGSDVVTDADLTLKAFGLPANQVAYFINSRNQGFAFNPGGSQGILCLAGAIGRHRAQIGSTAGGYVELKVDLSAVPTPSGLRAVLAGETWNWQLWFRDQNPGPTSNLTDGVSVTFQ